MPQKPPVKRFFIAKPQASPEHLRDADLAFTKCRQEIRESV